MAALVLACAPAGAGLFADPDPNWKEGEYALPPPPSENSLRQFVVSATSSNTYLVDESSLMVGDDRVVRYVLVVRTAGGAQNVTYEGIRCETGERRIYAIGRPGGEWSLARQSDWEAMGPQAHNRPRATLARAYFCDGTAPPRNREEVLRRLADHADVGR
ncbi:MAG: CNP1-like family protein [Rhodocyclales bacterium]|nr:CNP1-like family protein [Rhodocyclales bacterium]